MVENANVSFSSVFVLLLFSFFVIVFFSFLYAGRS